MKNKHFARPATLAVLCLSALLSNAAFALDSLPLERLQQGLWKVERKIDRGDGNIEVRNTEYCASPKKEITRTLRAASFLCKTTINEPVKDTFEVHAKCNLPGVSGENTTIIKLISDEKYTASVSTVGVKFGEKQSRKEFVTAIRSGDCTE